MWEATAVLLAMTSNTFDPEYIIGLYYLDYAIWALLNGLYYLAMTLNTFDLDSIIRWQDKSENPKTLVQLKCPKKSALLPREDTEDNRQIPDKTLFLGVN